MENEKTYQPGEIAWVDLTVPNAGEIRDFYQEVVGWKAREVEMGDYADYEMLQATTGNSVTGICYHRGINAQLPPQWLIYIIVENLEESIAACKSLGGSVVDGPREAQSSRLCVIQDPAGAFVALYQINKPLP
jgi:uncharacterized protein